MPGEASRLAGEASGQGEEASSEGLGGDYRLSHADTGGPAGEVVCHHPVSSTGQALDGQPGGVGGEASRWQVVEPHAVLEIANGVLDLGVARTPLLDWVGLQIQGVALTVGDEGVIAVVDEKGQLGATLCPCPGRAEVTNWRVRPKDVC